VSEANGLKIGASSAIEQKLNIINTLINPQ